MKRFFSPNSIAILMFAGVFISTLYANGYFNPVPYGQVKIHSVRAEGGKIYFVANFVKLKCNIVAFQVHTKYLGIWSPIEHEDYPKEPPTDNRLRGDETLSIRFDGDPLRIDEIQMKTRHDCDGENVDKIFARGNLSDWLEGRY